MMSFAKIKQYGLKKSLNRGLKAFFRFIGINYESYFIMSVKINPKELVVKMAIIDYSDVKILKLADFLNSNSTYFNMKKIEQIKQRFENENYHVYGIYDGGILVYSTWVYLLNKNSEDSSMVKTGLLLDSYCEPNARGNGLHYKMNLFRMKKMYEMGCKEAQGIVVSDNLPALKTQIKSGLKIVKQQFKIDFFGKKYCFEKPVK